MKIISEEGIWDYIRPDFRRPYVIAKGLVKANHIFDMRIKKKNDSTFATFVLCILGSNGLRKPHGINIIIRQLVGLSKYRKEHVIYEDFMVKKIMRVRFTNFYSSNWKKIEANCSC